MLRSLAALALAIALPLSSAAQDAAQLLREVVAHYKSLAVKSYEFEQVEVRESQGALQTQTQHRQRILGALGRFREETIPGGPQYIFDGLQQWSYNPDRNEYSRTAAPAVARLAPSLSFFEIAAYRLKSARLLGRETLDLASGPVECQMIEVEREPVSGQISYSPTTYWIDVSRSLVLKWRYRTASLVAGGVRPWEMTVTGTVTKAVLGAAADNSLLTFTPPEGAVRVERLFGPAPR